MPLVGLCGEPKEALEKIEYMMQALSLQGQFSEEDPVQAKKNRQTEFVRITEKSAEALEALDCLIWSGSCENVLSEEADSLLEEYPRLAVIFVADSTETNPYGVDLAFMFTNDPEKFSLEIPMSFYQYALQARSLEVVIPCEERVAGIVMYYPLSALIAVGI